MTCIIYFPTIDFDKHRVLDVISVLRNFLFPSFVLFIFQQRMKNRKILDRDIWQFICPSSQSKKAHVLYLVFYSCLSLLGHCSPLMVLSSIPP